MEERKVPGGAQVPRDTNSGVRTRGQNCHLFQSCKRILLLIALKEKFIKL